MHQPHTIKERIARLQQLLIADGLKAVIVNTADPHLSEYIADHWKVREFFSGFTGSAGTLVVGQDWAGLWTDSRYHLQARQQLEGTGITLFKDGLPGTPTIADEIGCHAETGDRVGIDMSLVTQADYRKTDAALQKNGASLHHYTGHYSLWAGRPALPNTPVFAHGTEYAGESARSKLDKIRAFAKEKGADATLVCGLDEIAFLLNLRASDISYNPVFYAYLLVYTTGGAHLLAYNEASGRDLASDPSIKPYLAECGVAQEVYADIDIALSRTLKWCVDANYTNALLMHILGDAVVERTTPTMLMKAVKNDVQIANLKQAQLADSVAMTQAFCWLDAQLAAGNTVTELGFANYLDGCRTRQKDFFCLSFNTISGFARHGAIVHYAVTPETDIPMQEGSFLLVDSGGNYLGGTTDITRTAYLGSHPSDEMRQDYTLVLKGHIALATTPFPQGTAGAQLDTLARQFLWKDGMDYGHGTGHGIGHFLCVHEGPQRISARNNNIPLQPGMLLSNEPGLYKEGRYGIRLENMVCVRERGNGPFGAFYHLETMSFFPFCSEAINPALLTQEELIWLNSYHRQTYEQIAATGLLTQEELAWLANKTAQITHI